jgi:hypothetical protein
MASQNIETERTLRAFFPSKLELISLPLFSLVFLAITNSFQLLRRVEGKDYLLIIEYMQLRFKEALSYLDTILGSTIPLVIFWMFVGIIVYIMLWVAIGAWTAYRDDLPADGKRMIVPKGYNHAKVLRGSLVHIFTRVISGGLLIVWIYLLFAELLPYSSRLFLKGIEVISLDNTYRCLIAVLIMAGSIFVTSVLTRCVVLRDRVFE